MNGDFDPTTPGDIPPAKIGWALGVLLERTKCIPDLVTNDECKAHRAEQQAADLRAALNGERGAAAKRVANAFAIKLVLISALASAALTGVVMAAVEHIKG